MLIEEPLTKSWINRKCFRCIAITNLLTREATIQNENTKHYLPDNVNVYVTKTSN